MILRDGKFYEGDQVVPLEFGNKEQIRLMNEAKYVFQALSGDGLEVDVEVESKITASVNFKCTCGQTVWFEVEIPEEDNFNDLDDEETNCPKCKNRYKLEYDSGETVVKFAKKLI